jgi:hypothetical protein
LQSRLRRARQPFKSVVIDRIRNSHLSPHSVHLGFKLTRQALDRSFQVHPEAHSRIVIFIGCCRYARRGRLLREPSWPNGNIQVWTKCLTQKDLDSIDIEHDNSDRALTVITYEVIADRAYLQPIARMLLANCSDRLSRQLSVYLNAPSEKSFSSERTRGGGRGEHVAPEGNTADLLKLVCPHQ